jgi:hypothetical protein
VGVAFEPIYAMQLLLALDQADYVIYGIVQCLDLVIFDELCATPLGSYEHVVVEKLTVRLHRRFKRRLLAKTPSEQERYATDIIFSLEDKNN